MLNFDKAPVNDSTNCSSHRSVSKYLFRWRVDSYIYFLYNLWNTVTVCTVL